jgi:hypothetical protein
MRYRLPETPDERSNARVLVLSHGVLGVINVGREFRENGICGNLPGPVPSLGNIPQTRLCRHNESLLLIIGLPEPKYRFATSKRSVSVITILSVWSLAWLYQVVAHVDLRLKVVVFTPKRTRNE